MGSYPCTAKKKVSEKGFEGFSGGKGFTALQETLAYYHGGFWGKGFSVSYISCYVLGLCK